jgi:hypothetical protein
MATQPVQHNERGHSQAVGSSKDVAWRILAEEAAQENDPEKLMKIIESLTQALEQAHAKK